MKFNDEIRVGCWISVKTVAVGGKKSLFFF